eukprot:SAG31_NODE_1760_length_7322_cov_2.480011_1_plen_374_part_00
MAELPQLPAKKALPTLSLKPVGDNPAADHGNTSFGIYQLEHSNKLEKERADQPFPQWSVDALADWLHREKRFPEYVSAFLEADISGAKLVSMLANTVENEEAWSELKVSKMHRIQISKAVRQYVAHAPGDTDDIGGSVVEEKTGIAALIGMWERGGYTPEVDDDVAKVDQDLLTKVRKEQAALLVAREKALATNMMVMMRLSAFAGRQRSKRSLAMKKELKSSSPVGKAIAATGEVEPEVEEDDSEDYGFSPEDYLEIIPEMTEGEIRASLVEIGKPPADDSTEDELRAQLTQYYRSQLHDGTKTETNATVELNPDSPWVEYMDETKNLPYYYNVDTEAVTWTMPTEGICGKEDDFESESDDEGDDASGDDSD